MHASHLIISDLCGDSRDLIVNAPHYRERRIIRSIVFVLDFHVDGPRRNLINTKLERPVKRKLGLRRCNYQCMVYSSLFAKTMYQLDSLISLWEAQSCGRERGRIATSQVMAI